MSSNPFRTARGVLGYQRPPQEPKTPSNLIRKRGLQEDVSEGVNYFIRATSDEGVVGFEYVFSLFLEMELYPERFDDEEKLLIQKLKDSFYKFTKTSRKESLLNAYINYFKGEYFKKKNSEEDFESIHPPTIYKEIWYILHPEENLPSLDNLVNHTIFPNKGRVNITKEKITEEQLKVVIPKGTRLLNDTPLVREEEFNSSSSYLPWGSFEVLKNKDGSLKFLKYFPEREFSALEKTFEQLEEELKTSPRIMDRTKEIITKEELDDMKARLKSELNATFPSNAPLSSYITVDYSLTGVDEENKAEILTFFNLIDPSIMTGDFEDDDDIDIYLANRNLSFWNWKEGALFM